MSRAPMKKCSYCGAENDDSVLQCAGCGTEFPDLRPKPSRPSRRTTAEVQQQKLTSLLNKQPIRKCQCGRGMRPIFIRGWFLLGSEDVIAAASALYECPGCRRKVQVPTVSMMVFLSILFIIFIWCAGALVVPGWSFGFSQFIFALLFLSPAGVTLTMLVNGCRKWRAHPGLK